MSGALAPMALFTAAHESFSTVNNAFEENRLMWECYELFPDQYHIHDRQVETGFHVLAHIHYWKNKYIIRRLAQQLS